MSLPLYIEVTSVIQKAVAFLKDVRNEMAQVSWSPTRELFDSTKVVIVTMLLLSVIVALFDAICSVFIQWILH